MTTQGLGTVVPLLNHGSRASLSQQHLPASHHHSSKRCWALLLCLVTCLTGGSPVAAADPETYTLEEPVDDTRVFGVGVTLDAKGKLLTKADKDQALTLDLTVKALLTCRERRLLGPGSGAEALRSIRDYDKADAEIAVANQQSKSTLPADLKLIVAQGRQEGLEFTSPQGNLTSSEHDLLRTPFDSLAIIGLLPTKPVAVGDDWTPPNWVPQLLTGIEAVVKSELTCRLAGVNGKTAQLEFSGRVEGATVGASSEIVFKGTLDYDLKENCIVLGDLTQTEKRSIGAVSPGLEVTARAHLERRPAKVPGRLAEPAIVEAGQRETTPANLLCRFDGPAGLRLFHHRDWHVFHTTENSAILRLMEQGGLTAQCNLSPLTSVTAGQHPAETDIQADIRNTLGEKFKSFQESAVVQATNQRWVYRTVAVGAVNEKPITWIYYVVTDASGRQASVVFTVDGKLLEKFGQQDRRLIDSLRFPSTSPK